MPPFTKFVASPVTSLSSLWRSIIVICFAPKSPFEMAEMGKGAIVGCSTGAEEMLLICMSIHIIHSWKTELHIIHSWKCLKGFGSNVTAFQLWINFLSLDGAIKQNLESVSAVLAKISWNFHPSPCGCSALAGNRQHITGLSIYYRDMPCFDGLYLKKLRSACSILGQNIDISFGPNGALHGARRWCTLRAASRSY